MLTVTITFSFSWHLMLKIIRYYKLSVIRIAWVVRAHSSVRMDNSLLIGMSSCKGISFVIYVLLVNTWYLHGMAYMVFSCKWMLYVLQTIHKLQKWQVRLEQFFYNQQDYPSSATMSYIHKKYIHNKINTRHLSMRTPLVVFLWDMRMNDPGNIHCTLPPIKENSKSKL